MAAKTETTAPAPKVEKGTAWLAEVIEQKTGKSYTPYQLRILLRRLVKDETIERGEGRWEFKGVTDPTVKAIIAAVKAGKLEESTRAGTDEAKKAEKKPAKKTVSKSRTKKPAEPVEEADEDEEDVTDEDDENLDDEIDEI